MKKFSPHLPPPVCDIDEHKKWQRLKVLLVATVFGLLAGLAGASVIIGWVWPGYGGGDLWVVTQNYSATLGRQAEDRIRNEKIASRFVAVYDGVGTLGTVNYFEEKKKLGTAIVVGSDGWLAMYLPNYVGGYKRWQVLTKDGSVFSVDKVLADSNSGILFLKVLPKDGASIADRVVDFNYTPGQFDELFVFDEDHWYSTTAGYTTWKSLTLPHIDTAPAAFLSLGGQFGVGSVVINEEGKVAGFVTKENLLLTNQYITRLLPDVLTKEKINYSSFGVDGWFDAEQPIIVGGERISGFVVSRVWSKDNLLRRGDVITEVNGKPASLENILLATNSKAAHLKILRGGKSLDLDVEITIKTQ